MLVKCMFSGSGGQGSALMAKLVCEGAMRENLKVVMTQTYGIEQRGGDSTAFIIISDEAIGSPIVENDATIAVALSQSIYEQCLHGVAPGGMLFTNASLVENPGTAEGFTQILLPVSEIAVEVGSVRSVNMVMLGAVIAKTKLLKRETIMAVLEETMGRKKPEPVSYTHLDVYKRQFLGDQHTPVTRFAMQGDGQFRIRRKGHTFAVGHHARQMCIRDSACSVKTDQ